MLKLILFLLIPAVCSGFFFSRQRPQTWNGLKVTWGLNPFTSFNDLPRTRAEATADGWVSISGCNDNAKFKGERYMKNNDLGVILIYGASGYIAGIQMAFPENYRPNPNRYPPQNLVNSPFVLDNGKYYLTAYFVNPENICTGRTPVQWDRDGTGEGLWIQNGTNPITDSLNIPLQQNDIDRTAWTQGKCFYTMGLHYWYNVTTDMNCDDFFPVFLMYNDGKLNSFGWAVGMNIITSSHLEHPLQSSYHTFLKPVPACLRTKGIMSTLHIYMTDSVLSNRC